MKITKAFLKWVEENYIQNQDLNFTNIDGERVSQEQIKEEYKNTRIVKL
jgi:hypothetical protein